MANSQKTKEKKSKKVIVIILIIPVVTAAVLVSLYLYADNAPVIFNGYNDNIKTGGEIEAKYFKSTVLLSPVQ